MNLRNHFLRDSTRKVKDAYANGRMIEMIKQGTPITPFEIVKVELEARKLVLEADDFKKLLLTLQNRFQYDKDISDYLSKQISSKYFMTPS
jgi:uncharacterized membrane protein